ncbi:hypothetical protein [Corynebacterium timonense]|uniref:Uncharacterized protein n=1 Tax=Corynebacterium timonense TaxID=441500 RepID=A0A1H1UNK2_9CORY|nr:hypothetical protein [Corynebacterium timonense]SDS74043.1 hypothetical protein SAMN04488539_2289 [Corynebacterium timonense]
MHQKTCMPLTSLEQSTTSMTPAVIDVGESTQEGGVGARANAKRVMAPDAVMLLVLSTGRYATTVDLPLQTPLA